MTSNIPDSSQKSVVFDIVREGGRYRLTFNIDPSETEAVKGAVASFFEALDEHGSLRNLKRGETTQFSITTGRVQIGNQIFPSKTAEQLSLLFPQRDPIKQKEVVASLTEAQSKQSEIMWVDQVQRLPNMGSTCFLNAALQVLAHPALLRELLDCPAAFLTSAAREIAVESPDRWPSSLTDPREEGDRARTYREQLHARAQQNPSLFKGGEDHPLFIVLSHLYRGIPITPEEMQNLIDRIVLDQKCAPFGGQTIGLARFLSNEQLDTGEALKAFTSQIDCRQLGSQFPHLVSSVQTHFSTEEFNGDPDKQDWIPVSSNEPSLFFPEVEIDPNEGLTRGLFNAVFDTNPDTTPLRRGKQTYLRKVQRTTFNTVPSHLVIGLSQTVPSLEEMSKNDQEEFLKTMREIQKENGEELPKINLDEKGILEAIFADSALFQKASSSVAARRKKEKKTVLYIPFKKGSSPLKEVPLLFTTPRWLALDGKEAVMELTGFQLHVGGAAGGHYLACVRRGNRFYELDDRMGDAPPKGISQEEFLRLAAERGRKLIYKNLIIK